MIYMMHWGYIYILYIGYLEKYNSQKIAKLQSIISTGIMFRRINCISMKQNQMRCLKSIF